MEHWEREGVGVGGTRMGTESASGQGRENEQVTKKERSKHKFKSFKKETGGDEYINLLLKA